MIKSQNAKYIKLGEKGYLEEICLSEKTIRLGYHQVPHDIGDNLQALQNFFNQKDFFKKDYQKSAATNHARQVYDFYTADKDTIWFTFSDGDLWWCQSDSKVEMIGPDGKEGSRFRKTINGWSNKSIANEKSKSKELKIPELSGELTKVAGYRGTICNIKDSLREYLLKKINGEEITVVKQAIEAREEILESIENLMKLLHWKDFELLAELVFAKSGWQRISASGGTQKTIDIEMVLPSTQEQAFIQVKSRTDDKTLQYYIDKLDKRENEKEKMFFVYHTVDHASEEIQEPENKMIILVGPQKLSEMVLDAGLFTWLLKKVG